MADRVAASHGGGYGYSPEHGYWWGRDLRWDVWAIVGHDKLLARLSWVRPLLGTIFLLLNNEPEIFSVSLMRTRRYEASVLSK